MAASEATTGWICRSGHEADVVEREDVGGIGHGQGEGVADPLDRAARSCFLAICAGTSFSTSGSDVDLRQRDRGHRCTACDRKPTSCSSVMKPRRTRMVPSLSARALLLGEGALELLGRDQPLGHQAVAETGQAALPSLARRAAPLAGRRGPGRPDAGARRRRRGAARPRPRGGLRRRGTLAEARPPACRRGARRPGPASRDRRAWCRSPSASRGRRCPRDSPPRSSRRGGPTRRGTGAPLRGQSALLLGLGHGRRCP